MPSRSSWGQRRRGGEQWIVRTYHPRPHSDAEAVTDWLFPLYGVEADLRGGRFHAYTTDELTYQSAVDLSELTDEDERRHRLEMLMEWVADSRQVWSLVFEPTEAVRMLVGFDDPETATGFDILYGGVLGRPWGIL